jgi:hypothetical protein
MAYRLLALPGHKYRHEKGDHGGPGYYDLGPVRPGLVSYRLVFFRCGRGRVRFTVRGHIASPHLRVLPKPEA